MAYTDVITLDEAKNYLRIDLGFTTDDNAITQMIKSALAYVENETSHIMFARNVDFLFDDYQKVRVYKYPINSLVTPTDAEREEKTTYSIYTTDNSSNTTLTLNVGYSDPDNVPKELKEFALYLIDRYYYGKEGKESDSDNIPMWVKSPIMKYKRFIF